MTRRALLPFSLLLGFGLVFAAAALGDGLLVFDDHPGQFFRLWHGLTRGLLPWEWNPDWWGGYPELQFYPPGYVYLGALIHYGSLGLLPAHTIYQILLWIIYLLPGATAFWLLTRLLPDPWLALPPAFVILTLSADTPSGVEGGLRVGMIAARLGWGLLPLLALSLLRWQERGGKFPRLAPLLLAAITLTHPAHAPAGAALLVLAAFLGSGSRGHRVGQAGWALLLAIGLTGFWTLPLVGHLGFALPLAWGEFSLKNLGRVLSSRPLLAVLLAAYLAGCMVAVRQGQRDGPIRSLLALLPALLALVMLDALLLEPMGFRWIPADRLLDSAVLALALGAGVGIAWALRFALDRSGLPIPAMGLLATLALLALPFGTGEATLTLWPKTGAWPKLEETARGLRLDGLWDHLRGAPPGRVLFVRSGVPLRYRGEWWRPHTHITALTPLFTGREIINGIFTHPSPVAGLVYTGSAANQPLTRLVEELDGTTLFGQPLPRLTAEAFTPFAQRLLVSTVVALEEDRGRLPFVESNPLFGPPRRIGPFAIFSVREPQRVPELVAPRRWRLRVGGTPGGWTPTGIAFYPLWRAETPAGPLAVRRDQLGMLEVNIPPGSPRPVDLVYREGPWEWLGIVLSFLTLTLWGASAWTTRP